MIGILGGTFDPIHFGHLRIAQEVMESLGLSQVRFIPAASPPHREPPVADGESRRQMVARAIADEPRFVMDTREFEREGPSYMVDTLASLKEDFPDRTLVLILGMDAFNGLPGWDRWEMLFELAHLAVATRPGNAATGGMVDVLAERQVDAPQDLRQFDHGRVAPVAVTPLDISATAIREHFQRGRSPRYLMPDAAIEVAKARGIYA